MWSATFFVIGALYIAASFRLRRDWRRLGAGDKQAREGVRVGGRRTRAGDNIVRSQNIYWGPYWWGFTVVGGLLIVAAMTGTFA